MALRPRKAKVPFKITKLPKINGNQCEFTVELSYELAEELILAAAPLMERLKGIAAKKREQEERSTVHLRSMMDD